MMGMASYTTDLSLIEREFNDLNKYFKKYKFNLELDVLSIKDKSVV